MNNTPCWIWCGPLHLEGYGIIYRGGETLRVHRVIYETVYGEIPPTWEVHHHCGVKNCCNPEHLEAMSGVAHRKIHAPDIPHPEKTHCKNGHAFTPENTARPLSHGRRNKRCKICDREKATKYNTKPEARAKRRATENARRRKAKL